MSEELKLRVNHRIRSRSEFANLCNAFGILDAVEIGTHQAVFAEEFMSKFYGTIVMVDPWDKPSTHDGGIFLPCFDSGTSNREDDFVVAVHAMAKYGSRAVFVKRTSEEALPLFEDNTVGFVYIDGLHDYENASFDIWHWWPKVAPGGILAGHDYCEYLPDVIRAVDEFVEKTGLQLSTTCDCVESWWIRKPERPLK